MFVTSLQYNSTIFCFFFNMLSNVHEFHMKHFIYKYWKKHQQQRYYGDCRYMKKHVGILFSHIFQHNDMPGLCILKQRFYFIHHHSTYFIKIYYKYQDKKYIYNVFKQSLLSKTHIYLSTYQVYIPVPLTKRYNKLCDVDLLQLPDRHLDIHQQ